jgi:ABC-type uncharacterized transport system permease subunit
MTADAHIVKSALGIDFVEISILRVLFIRFAFMTGNAFPQLRNAAFAFGMMASCTSGVRLGFGFVNEFRVWTD